MTSTTPPPASRTSHLRRESAWIAVLAVTVFVWTALWHYHPTDPAWSQLTENTVVDNVEGVVGAWTADVLLSLVGVVAYALPLLLGWVGLRGQPREGERAWERWRRRLGVGVWLVLSVSAAAGLCSLFATSDGSYPSGMGGWLGQTLAWSLMTWSGVAGASVLLITTVLLGCGRLMRWSWLHAFEQLGAWGQRFALWVRERREARRIRQQAAAPSNPPKQRSKRQRATSTPSPVDPSPAPPRNKRAERRAAATLSSEHGGLEAGDVTLPSVACLDPSEPAAVRASDDVLQAMARRVEQGLKDFGVDVDVVAVNPGPVVTRFELSLAAGTKVSKIATLAKDLARALSVVSVRVVEVIPGKPVIGLEVPNEHREIVRLRDVVDSKAFARARASLPLALGHDISGQPVVVDLAKMPHLLVAGTTGSGKSVGLNAMLLSLLYRCTPDDTRMILIDPKMLELSVYEGVPHLLTPVVTDMQDAASALRWCVAEMERRYRLMAGLGVRNLAGYNQKIKEGERRGQPVLDPLSVDDPAPALTTLPHLVVVCDEFADMIMVLGKNVEKLIARLAQKARAAGIHLILATQRPSVDVITGLIKANIPTRIAFQVSSKIDSRTILDQSGADQLLGHGDMLYLPPGTAVPQRVHGAYVSDNEVHRVVAHWREVAPVDYHMDVLQTNDDSGEAVSVDSLLSDGGSSQDRAGEGDTLYDMAVALVTQTRRASISSVQRRLKIGYNRAANLVEAMEAAGVVGPMESNGQRSVLAPPPPGDAPN